MPIISFRDTGVQYFYLDSGKPNSPVYDTIVILHGHTFHNGTFQRLLEPARSRSLRIIAVNRRGYPGSTPITEQEVRAMNSQDENLVQEFIQAHGTNLALMVDALAIELDLPPGRNVTLCAWSLGNCFLVTTLGSIEALESDVRNRLKKRVKAVILWDPPGFAFGTMNVAGGHVPLYDDDIAPERRVPAFASWVSSYWKHGDLSSRDFNQLEQRIAPQVPLPSTDRMTPKELASMISSSPEAQVPDHMFVLSPLFVAALKRQSQKAFLDPAVREMWGNPLMCHLMGDLNCWPVIYGHWCAQELMADEENVKAGLAIDFKSMEGANHFVMWEHPEMTVDVLRDCISGNMTTVHFSGSCPTGKL